ncbi:unnamed protein product [Dovyalis caffra]|uniref:Myb-like domain-containing protein n=1 Tax=Dovyalis caffra TaxID=77055 RepID=A0AAV1S1J5_9ROSI|nr:unnamed protein product [Dovyalis caffra]
MGGKIVQRREHQRKKTKNEISFLKDESCKDSLLVSRGEGLSPSRAIKKKEKSEGRAVNSECGNKRKKKAKLVKKNGSEEKSSDRAIQIEKMSRLLDEMVKEGALTISMLVLKVQKVCVLNLQSTLWLNIVEIRLGQLDVGGLIRKTLADALGKHRFHVKDTSHRIKLLNTKKGKWSQYEYQSLFDLVNLDLRMKTFDEKKTKHGILRDNTSFTTICEKLETRTDAFCCKKWCDQLTSPIVAEGKWLYRDYYWLLLELYDLDACCMKDVDWDNLLEHRSGHLCSDGTKWSNTLVAIVISQLLTS